MEVSLGVSSVPFNLVGQVIVDHIAPDFEVQVRGVFEAAGGDGKKVAVRTVGGRPLAPDRIGVFRELVAWSRSLNGKVPKAKDLRDAVPDSLTSWAGSLPEPLWGPLRQWLEYTYTGTLSAESETDSL